MQEKLKTSKSELLIGQEQIKKWTEEKKRISKQKVNPLLKEIYRLKEFPESLKKEILKLRIKIIK